MTMERHLKNCGTNIKHEIYLLNNKINFLKCLILHLCLNVKKKKKGEIMLFAET